MKKFIFIFIGILSGILAYCLYVHLNNSDFDTGLLCSSSTECYEVTKRIIIYCTIISTIVNITIYFFQTKIYSKISLEILILGAIIVLNISLYNDSSTYWYLAVYDFLIILSFFVKNLLDDIHDKKYNIINNLFYTVIIGLTISYLLEFFYSNSIYDWVGEILLLFLISLLFIYIITPIIKRRFIGKKSNDNP